MLSAKEKGTVCFLKPKFQLPTEDSQGSVAHFWSVEETRVAEEANMALYMAAGSRFHVLRNSKLIKEGDRLYKLTKEPEKRGSGACGSDAHTKKRKWSKDS